MPRTILLMLSVSALALAACAEQRSDAELGADEAAEETGEAMNDAGDEMDEAADDFGDEWNEARDDLDQSMDDESMDGGIGQSAPVNAIQDAASIVVGSISGGVAGLTGDPETYARNAHLANVYQIEAGRLAVERGGSEEIRELGEMIVSEHEAQQSSLEAALREAGHDFDLPAELEGRRQGLLDNLGAASDTTFDSAFLQQQSQIHSELAALHNGFEARGQGGEALVSFADDAGDAAGEALEQISSRYGAAVDGE